MEDRESLAQIAASGEDTSLSDGETYIGKGIIKTAFIYHAVPYMYLPMCPHMKHTLDSIHSFWGWG